MKCNDGGETDAATREKGRGASPKEVESGAGPDTKKRRGGKKKRPKKKRKEGVSREGKTCKKIYCAAFAPGKTCSVGGRKKEGTPNILNELKYTRPTKLKHD